MDSNVENPKTSWVFDGGDGLREEVGFGESRPNTHNPPVLTVSHTEGVPVLVQGEAMGHEEG